MRKFAFSTFTICIPLVAAILCAIYSAHAASMRRQATTVFHKSIDNQINTKYSTGVDGLVAAYGQEHAARIVESKAKANTAIAFDGVSRLAKVVRHTKEWTGPDPTGTGYSDGVVLKDFGHPTAAVWDGPMGTRISSVHFVDDNLVVSVYGNLHLGASTRMVPQEHPEDYIVPWPKGSKPKAGSLYTSVVARHRNGG